jgi:GxxExxY protein
MAFTDEERALANGLSNQIIGAAIEVHRHLGPGLLESAYRACLARELEVREIPFLQEVYLPLEYKGVLIEKAYRLDLFVAGTVVIELKALEKIEPIHEAQLLTYLRLTERWLGLLINFNVPVLKNGIKRMVLG